MAFINDVQDVLSVKSELDLFASTPMQTGIESGSLQTYRPVTSISNNGPIEFVVSGTSTEEYLDLARVYIHVKARLNVPTLDPATAQPTIGPVNNWLHSMFSQVDVFLNQKCKQSHLTSNLWYEDTPGHMNKYTDAHTGFTSRLKHTKDGQIVDLYGPLHCDLFNVDKLLLSGVEMSIKLQRSNNAFHLMGGSDAGIFEIVDAELHVRKVKISPSVILAHNQALAVATAKYPINRVDVKAITIPAGSQTKTMDNVYLGMLPKRCIIGFVNTTAFNGSVAENPFNFQHFDYSYLAFYLDSTPVPSKPFLCDFPNNQFIRAYNSLFEGCNINHADIGNSISRDSYAKGYALVVVDFTPDLCASSADHISQPRTGSLRIEVRFNNALTNSVTAVIFSEFSGNIDIDKNRNIVTDYSS
ncbi:hypothetical protein Bhyg_07580 [Pseudolycoriella hygida]|uniref:Uncharacterized protein n=1 Tax=Pseudolycoriella hygida TaxID=35572 RepID=A0A9Q0S248_9DIPT|nr:hypothetical protein Bhyg_07580 [Pseudolycoriella hygida]